MSKPRGERVVDVVIVGAGPVGLWLAAELRLAGVDVLVLERLPSPTSLTKSLTVQPRTVELLAMRGLAEGCLALGKQVPSSHFALMSNRLDFTVLDTNYPFALFLPQPQLEAVLAEHANALGVPVLREHTVLRVREEGEAVAVDTETPHGDTAFHGRWVVGCDGASSVVRKSTGIGFEGAPTTMSAAIADVRLADPPQAVTLTWNEDNGALFLVALGGDRYRLAVIDHATLDVSKDEPLTLDELRQSTRRVAGTDFGTYEASSPARFGNATLQAERYRRGRVLVAGDAAHIHPPLGGQGLNLGVQDASNLAWKLGAVVRGWASPAVLDSYTAERHPVGQRVISDTRAQTALVAATTPEGKALRARFNELLGTHPSLNRELAERLSGLSVAYTPAAEDGSPLVGRRMPDLKLAGAPAPSVFGLLRRARFVLLDATGGGLAERFAGFGPGLDVACASDLGIADRPEWAGVRAVLLRPDGHIAWVGVDASEASAAHLGRAFVRWFDSTPA